MNLLLDMSLREILTGITPIVRARNINVGEIIPSKPVWVRFCRSRILRCETNIWKYPLKYCINANTVKNCMPYKAVKMLNNNAPRIYLGCDYELNKSGDWEYEFTH